MKSSGFISSEFKQLFRKKSVLISVIIALLVPLIYAMVVLSPKWGPYDNLDNLPVAVVNNDAGAVSDGERIEIGEQLIESLQENRALGWDFVTSEEADRGMKSLKYYMVIEVPEDFSKKAVTVMDDNPERPELNFIQNEGLHFMAAQVTNNAIELVKNELNSKITETYVDNVFDQLDEVGDGFQEAADGAEQVNEGAGQLKDGSEEILSGLTDKSGDIGKLADGARDLNDGTRTMRDSLVSKQGDISKLAAGSNELHAGTGAMLANLRGKAGDIRTLATGAGQLHAGTNQLKSNLDEKAPDIGKLAAGAKQLNAGTNELKTGLTAQKADVEKLSVGATQVKEGITGLKDGAGQVLSGLRYAKEGSSQLKDNLPILAKGSAEIAGGVTQVQSNIASTIGQMNELKIGLQSLKQNFGHIDANLDGTLEQMIRGLDASLQDAPAKAEQLQILVSGTEELKNNLAAEGPVAKGIIGLDAGLGELVAGQTQVVSGSEQLEIGATDLAAGNKSLVTGWNTIIAGVSELDAGASQLNAGNQSVNAGWKELQQGAGELQAGAGQVADGNKTVESGWNQLAAGAAQLNAGSSQIADGNRTVESGWRELSAGATQLHDGSSQIADGNATVKEGWDTLTDGVTQVDDGLLQLVDGSDELKTGLQGGAERTSEINPTDDNVAMFAEPVVLSGKVINSLPFYRDSNAPYILTLALYVGILVMSFVVAFDRPATMPSSPITWFIGKVSKISLLAIAQALIISLYSLFILKIEVQSSMAFVLYSLFVSLTFLMIILFLVVLAGNIGRFIALAFVVLQLSTTGSALPVHMLPEGLRNLSTFLPFTHSITGFRNIITLGNSSAMWSSISVLFIYFLIFVALSLGVFFWKFRSLRAEPIDITEDVA